MSEKFTLELDDEAFTLASGAFPDGAVWLKVTAQLPPSARLMRIRAVALRDMNDFMLLAQLVEAVRHVTDVAFSHLETAVAAVGASGSSYGAGRQLCAEGLRPAA